MKHTKSALCVGFYVLLVASFQVPASIEGSSVFEDFQERNCQRLLEPELRKMCELLMMQAYSWMGELGSVRGTRSSNPVALQSILSTDGLGDLAKLEPFRQLLANEDSIPNGGLLRITDDMSTGRWQPMRGKRTDSSKFVL